ncbi:hypothetical protein [Eisenbergiella tayi]|uniref:hypothetical protein n=1 Tax=Eisenbergiella tayi TaxID=1432052 RepID=UPI00307BD644
MNKCVCDICCDKPAVHKFKVKREKITNFESLTKGYVRIDICEACFHRLMSVHNDKKTEDLIWEFMISDDHLKKYVDDDMQSAYIAGFDAVIGLLTHKRILHK